MRVGYTVHCVAREDRVCPLSIKLCWGRSSGQVKQTLCFSPHRWVGITSNTANWYRFSSSSITKEASYCIVVLDIIGENTVKQCVLDLQRDCTLFVVSLFFQPLQTGISLYIILITGHCPSQLGFLLINDNKLYGGKPCLKHKIQQWYFRNTCECQMVCDPLGDTPYNGLYVESLPQKGYLVGKMELLLIFWLVVLLFRALKKCCPVVWGK